MLIHMLMIQFEGVYLIVVLLLFAISIDDMNIFYLISQNVYIDCAK